MSLFKRLGLLPFYKSDYSQDWQLTGYFDEYINAIQFIPRDKLVGFRTPFISAVLTDAPTQITIRRLSLSNETKSILESTNYTVTISIQHADENFKNCEQSEATYTYYYFNQSVISTDVNDYLTAGRIYEIYLEDSSDNSFISNIFCAIDETQIYVYSEDGQIILGEDGESILFE